MPLTFPAHQAPVLPLKLWRPPWFDATALCVAAAAPDLAYPLGSWLGRQSHTAIGVVVWAVPVTLLVCAILRWRAAAVISAHLPDFGPLRLKSYGVLTCRRPAVWVTLLSAFLGAASHVVIDGFTHTGRWGAEWLGLTGVIAEVPLRGEVTTARLLQYLGHVGGSLAAIGLFANIGRHRLLERWYGIPAVETARATRVRPVHQAVFWSVTLAPPLAVLAWSIIGHQRLSPFLLITTTAAGLISGGSLPLHTSRVPSGRPSASPSSRVEPTPATRPGAGSTQ